MSDYKLQIADFTNMAQLTLLCMYVSLQEYVPQLSEESEDGFI